MDVGAILVPVPLPDCMRGILKEQDAVPEAKLAKPRPFRQCRIPGARRALLVAAIAHNDLHGAIAHLLVSINWRCSLVGMYMARNYEVNIVLVEEIFHRCFNVVTLASSYDARWMNSGDMQCDDEPWRPRTVQATQVIRQPLKLKRGVGGGAIGAESDDMREPGLEGVPERALPTLRIRPPIARDVAGKVLHARRHFVIPYAECSGHCLHEELAETPEFIPCWMIPVGITEVARKQQCVNLASGYAAPQVPHSSQRVKRPAHISQNTEGDRHAYCRRRTEGAPLVGPKRPVLI
eukprot:CAMPEP_0180493866 /NCGR_PEP_ID=MMETSP1036_2-20121128/40932_1 /TAXON_ID=632150 /ORGANISM="Azadinium spinosum, Strain 3D9" /LENGTH=292 /DNA_ID=CAMNT_0022502265 /DNA_START=48 /DNA_END=924 /DNA_ORIENTATION=+